MKPRCTCTQYIEGDTTYHASTCPRGETLVDRVARRLRDTCGVDDLYGITLHWPLIVVALMEEEDEECEVCAGGGRC